MDDDLWSSLIKEIHRLLKVTPILEAASQGSVPRLIKDSRRHDEGFDTGYIANFSHRWEKSRITMPSIEGRISSMLSPVCIILVVTRLGLGY